MLGEADKQTQVEWPQSVPGREQMPLRGTSFLPILCAPPPPASNNQCLLSTWETATATRWLWKRERDAEMMAMMQMSSPVCLGSVTPGEGARQPLDASFSSAPAPEAAEKSWESEWLLG